MSAPVVPRFSVVVPALNEEGEIGGCLASLAQQDFAGAVEVIVVDNGSEDATVAVARSYGALVVVEPRPGVCWARQAGTAAARGEIVVSTDADTTFDRGWLRRIDAEFTRDTTVVAVAGPCRFVDGPRWGGAYATLLFGTVSWLHRLLGRVFYVTATNVAFRRAAFPGYQTHLTQGGDELGLLRGLRRAGRVVFMLENPTFTSARRLHRGFAYNVLVTGLYFYLLTYLVNRVAGRRVLGSAPAVRDDATRRAARRVVVRRGLQAGAVLALVLTAHYLDVA